MQSPPLNFSLPQTLSSPIQSHLTVNSGTDLNHTEYAEYIIEKSTADGDEVQDDVESIPQAPHILDQKVPFDYFSQHQCSHSERSSDKYSKELNNQNQENDSIFEDGMTLEPIGEITYRINLRPRCELLCQEMKLGELPDGSEREEMFQESTYEEYAVAVKEVQEKKLLAEQVVLENDQLLEGETAVWAELIRPSEETKGSDLAILELDQNLPKIVGNGQQKLLAGKQPERGISNQGITAVPQQVNQITVNRGDTTGQAAFQGANNNSQQKSTLSHSNVSNSQIRSTQQGALPDLNQNKVSNMSSNALGSPSRITDEDQYEKYILQEVADTAANLQSTPLAERKSKESKIVRDWNRDKSGACYMVDFKWALAYTKWLSSGQSELFTQPITNMNLVESKSKNVKLDIKEKIHFETLSSKLYLLMRQLYGGGPDLPFNTFLLKQQQLKQLSNKTSSDGYLSQQSASTQATTNGSSLAIHSLESNGLSSRLGCSIPQRKMQLGIHGLTVLKAQVTRKPPKIVSVFQDTLKIYSKSSETKPIDLSGLKNALKKPFVPHQQQDAQEFIRFLLSELQDELNPRLPAKNPTEFKSEESAFEYYQKYQNSIIDKIFAGQLSSDVKCSKCRAISRTFDPFLDLSLSMEGLKGSLTLEECASHFFQEEILTDDYRCEKCGQKNKAKKQVSISRTPAMLVFHLKRFKAYQKKRKISDFVRFPLNDFSLQPFLSGKNCGASNFNLLAMLVHFGNSLDSGHYAAFVKRDNKWLYCDDSKVQEVSEKVVLKQEAYLLFYQRQEISETNLKKQATVKNYS